MKKFRVLIIDFIVISLILLTTIFLVAFQKFEWREAFFLFVLIYVINFIFIIFIVVNKDSYEEKISWIFFLTVAPIITHIFFALFRFRSTQGVSRDKYEKEFKKFFLDKVDNSNLKLSEFELVQQQKTKRFFFQANIEIFQHGYNAYQVLINDLKQAKDFIHIEMYILKPSEIFETIKNILIEKAKSGVEVKMIVDDFGSWKITKKEFDYLISFGIQIQKFNKTIYPFVRHTDNKRLHRKFFVIDGRVVHFGGLNIADEYGSFNKIYGYWADMNFRTTGQIVNDYESIFLYDWFILTNLKLDKNKYLKPNQISTGNSHMLLFDEGPNNHDNLLERLIDNWINNSIKNIKIITPYFVPTQQILNSLIHALKIGINIEIYIPGLPDKKLVYESTKHNLNKLKQIGAKIYVLNNIFLHTKMVIFDDEFAYIGTNNFDMRSLYSNYEAINIILGKKPLQEMNQILENYKKISIDLKPEKSKLITKTKEFIFRILAPLM